MLWFGALLVVLAGVCQGIATILGIPIEDRKQLRDKTSKLSSAIERSEKWPLVIALLGGLVGVAFVKSTNPLLSS
jgi:hypothetical protein